MESAKKAIAIAISILALVACDAEQVSHTVHISSDQVALVSSGFMNGDRPGVSIYIGPDEFNFFDITLDRANVIQGYTVQDRRNNVENFSLTANWQGEHYAQSINHATYSSFTVRSLSSTEAVIELSGKLLSVASGTFLVLEPSTVKIRGELLKNLTARP